MVTSPVPPYLHRIIATPVMEHLSWLVEQQLQEAIRHEHTWAFMFDGEVTLTTECLWRLVEQGRIRLTSADDGQQFGLPEALDAALKLNQAVAGAKVESVVLRHGTLDLEIEFETGHVLQVIPDSSGYEAWNARKPGWVCIAVGGGDLIICNDI